MNYETNNPQPDNKLLGFIKSNAKRIGVACLLLVTGAGVTYATIDPLAELRDLEETYEDRLIKRNQAAEYYNLAQKKWCETRVQLANKKLELYYSKDLELSKHEMVRLSNLVEAGCEPAGEALGLTEDQASPKTAKLCYKNTAGEDQNQYVRIAAEISNNDLDFLATVEGENDLWTPDRKHTDGIGHGFCGISYPWHKEIIEDPRFLTDPRWQLEQCWRLYSGGTRFYAFDVRHKHFNKFTCPDRYQQKGLQ